ncbi:4Fe-4S dicluster domain-containing protein [Heliophilum fasciatum]|uniref:Ferredoxin n=1 Tax=Heliophilum fasciatum TaxID=35700 RepID=A0A4R2S0D6_9FIRM|nr:4Fe-4S dicluster domain-containing protein [Heliophilum fasciatum]MCW2276903.1 NAD-dependent dihydropyrimidine dehydrogenase PreA subunit/DNA-binding transcriptional ArsR family regulator [Heliophilum fasciatum]TCP68637.1 4Fe-4S dicluster protein [Heliophilum fasciatum]
MGHLGIGKADVFRALAHRLDQNPTGAPMNETLMQILHIMYSEPEAQIGSTFPQGFTTSDKIAKASGLPEATVHAHLESMANKGLIIDVPRKGKSLYMLSPLVIGFFEYTFMRVTDQLPMHDLAHLFEQYHLERGVSESFFGAETKMFQTWPYESTLPDAAVETEVMPYEKASAMIRDAGGGSLTMCYCRHQAWHRGTACDAPLQDVCTSLGTASEFLVRRGFARPATVDELLRVLEQTEKLGLVHLADNVQNRPAYLCHCCGCCCGALRVLNEQGIPSVHPSNYIPVIDAARCTGCGACVDACHVHALALIDSEPGAKTRRQAMVLTERCIGCGACIQRCSRRAMTLHRRTHLHIPPKDKREQLSRIAKEKGQS